MNAKTRFTLGPVIFASSIFLEITGAFLLLSLAQNNGHLIYNLDDSYIHMAIAKNFALYNVWGMTRYGFTSATSSPLWTLLLSILYKLFGVSDYTPLIMNVVCAVGIIALVQWIMTRYDAPRWFSRYVLVALVFLMPFPTIALTGLEHMLHTLACIAFVYYAAQVLADDGASHYSGAQRPTAIRMLLFLSALMTSVRYESVFAIGVVCLLLLIRRRWVNMILVGICGALPVVVYGLISIANGSMFLPNSVILKGYKPDLSSLSGIASQFGLVAFHQLGLTPHILVFVLIALVLIYLQLRSSSLWSSTAAIMAVIFIGMAFLHMQFARVDWFYRYEAYLIVLGLFVASVLVSPYLPEKFSISLLRQSQVILVAVIGFFFLLPAITRGIAALHNTPGAMHEVYEQQYQLADFIKTYYNGNSLAIHDIGLINYMDDIVNFDVQGISDANVMRIRMAGNYTTAIMDQLARDKGAKIAVTYTYDVPTPDSWIRLADWEVPTWIVVGGPKVSFFAIDPAQKDSLLAHLKEFAPRLPADVTVTYPAS